MLFCISNKSLFGMTVDLWHRLMFMLKMDLTLEGKYLNSVSRIVIMIQTLYYFASLFVFDASEFLFNSFVMFITIYTASYAVSKFNVCVIAMLHLLVCSFYSSVKDFCLSSSDYFKRGVHV